MRPLKLSPRLMAVVGFIHPGSRVADIGTDHARLPVYLIEHSIASRVIALDISPGPLEQAQKTLLKHKLNGIIELRLSNGAFALEQTEADTVVIAGMGGESILSIVDNAPWLKEKQLIIQPQTKAKLLVESLTEFGYALTDMREVCEGRRKYNVFLFG